MKDIKELALKVAKEMNWRMDEMTLETFAARLIAAYTAEQEPVAWVPQFSWQRSIDAVACSSKRSFDDIPLFTAPPEPTQAVESAIAQLVTALQQSKGWMRDYADSIIRDAIDRKTAPSSEEVREMVVRLNAVGNTSLEYAAADLIERLAAVRDGWIDSAREFCNGMEYYRGLIDEAAKHIGIDMYTADDQVVHTDPLRAKLPECVERLAARVPDWCVVVPREATDEMLLAAESVKQYELSTPRLRWEAMIAAWEVSNGS